MDAQRLNKFNTSELFRIARTVESLLANGEGKMTNGATELKQECFENATVKDCKYLAKQFHTLARAFHEVYTEKMER